MSILGVGSLLPCLISVIIGHGKNNAGGVVSRPIFAGFYGAPSTSHSLTILASSSITMMLAATIAPEVHPALAPREAKVS